MKRRDVFDEGCAKPKIEERVRLEKNRAEQDPDTEFARRQVIPDEWRQENRCRKTPKSSEEIKKGVDDEFSRKCARKVTET
jgi:hypothetical protein